MTKYERVRDGIFNLIEGSPYGGFELVDQILSLVEIRADDQTAPSSFDYDEDYDTEDAYGLGRSDIIKAGFVKVAPKPNV